MFFRQFNVFFSKFITFCLEKVLLAQEIHCTQTILSRELWKLEVPSKGTLNGLVADWSSVWHHIQTSYRSSSKCEYSSKLKLILSWIQLGVEELCISCPMCWAGRKLATPHDIFVFLMQFYLWGWVGLSENNLREEKLSQKMCLLYFFVRPMIPWVQWSPFSSHIPSTDSAFFLPPKFLWSLKKVSSFCRSQVSSLKGSREGFQDLFVLLSFVFKAQTQRDSPNKASRNKSNFTAQMGNVKVDPLTAPPPPPPPPPPLKHASDFALRCREVPQMKTCMYAWTSTWNLALWVACDTPQNFSIHLWFWTKFAICFQLSKANNFSDIKSGNQTKVILHLLLWTSNFVEWKTTGWDCASAFTIISAFPICGTSPTFQLYFLRVSFFKRESLCKQCRNTPRIEINNLVFSCSKEYFHWKQLWSHKK